MPGTFTKVKWLTKFLDALGIETTVSPSTPLPVLDGINERDYGNEQTSPLGSAEVFDGTFRKISEVDHTEFLYAATTPFTAKKIWSNDGVNPLGGTFGESVLPQRVVQGYNVVYDVGEGRDIAPYYRIQITNGATPQTAFPGFISIAWLIRTPYQGSFTFLDAALTQLSKALLVRAVLAGTLPDGTFGNAGLTAQSDLRVGFESVADPNNTVSSAPLAAYGGVKFLDEDNLNQYFGAAVPAAPADTWLAPEWTDAKNFAAFSLNAFHSGLGQGYAIWSTDGATISRIETTAFGGARAFTDPPQGSTHFKIALQNRGPSPTVFFLSTQLRYGPQNLFMFPASAPIDGSFPAALTKSVGTGRQPDADYADERTSGSIPEFSTQTTLAADATYAPIIVPGLGSGRNPEQLGPGYDTTGFVSVYVIVNASHASAPDGLIIEFSNDGFATIAQEFAFTYSASMVGNGRRFLVPANAGEQVRIRYTNGPTAQTSFDLRTELSVTQVQPMSDDIGRGTLLVSPGLRISQVLKRQHREVNVTAQTASGILFNLATLFPGFVYHVTSHHISLENSSGAVSARVRIRDGSGGPAKMAASVDEATVGLAGINPTRDVSGSHQEPIRFETNVFFEVAAGTVTCDIVLIGYLEPVE